MPHMDKNWRTGRFRKTGRENLVERFRAKNGFFISFANSLLFLLVKNLALNPTNQNNR
jgi:hypothetical protein